MIPEVFDVDLGEYLRTLRDGRPYYASGMLSDVLRNMQVGQQWRVPDEVYWPSVKTLCSKLNTTDRQFICRKRGADKRVTRTA